MKPNDKLAQRNRELTVLALEEGLYGEAYLDLDVDAFQAYRENASRDCPLGNLYDKPMWDHMMRNVKPGDEILCLAGGGGQQSVIYSLLGAHVTVLDLTDEQLQRDQAAADHYGYEVTTIEDDMRDLTSLSSNHYQKVHQPISLLYVPDLKVIYSGVNGVLKEGGLYYSDYTFPPLYMSEDMGWDGKGYVHRFSQPYRNGQVLEREGDGTMTFSEGESFGESNHTLSDIVNGLTGSGFLIVGLWENPRDKAREADFAQSTPGSAAHKSSILPFGLTVIAQKMGHS